MSFIPWWAKWAVLAALLALLGVQEIRINQRDVKWAKHQQLDSERALASIKERDAVYDYWQGENLKKDQTYEEDKRLFDSAVATLESDRDDLRSTLQRFAKRNSTCPPITPGGPAVDRGDPIGVLADVYSRTDAAAEVFARTAESRKLTASACEARYETLTKQSP